MPESNKRPLVVFMISKLKIHCFEKGGGVKQLSVFGFRFSVISFRSSDISSLYLLKTDV